MLLIPSGSFESDAFRTKIVRSKRSFRAEIECTTAEPKAPVAPTKAIRFMVHVAKKRHPDEQTELTDWRETVMTKFTNETG